MGCTCNAVLRLAGKQIPAVPQAAVLHGGCGRWWRGWMQHHCPTCGDYTEVVGAAQPPQPAVDQEKVKTYKDSGTEVLFPFFFLKCRGVHVKGRGRIPTLVPVCLLRGCAVLTLPDPHSWAEPSACVVWQEEWFRAWGKAPWSQWEHFYLFSRTLD